MPEEVIIIGGSFAGLSAAMQLARGQRKVTVIDAGEPRNRFANQSHGFFGLDGVSPYQIQQEAQRQLLKYPTVTLIEDTATAASKEEGLFHVTLGNGQTINSKKLILATGLKDEIPDIPGLRERWGATVAHCPYCHGYELRNQPLGVIATSPHSIHQAILLPDWGPTTYFTQGQFERILYQRSGKQAPKTHMASTLAEQLGCEFEEGPLGLVIKTDEMKQTNITGLFAAGDTVNPMQNATFASAAGVMAGVGAHHALIQDA